MPTPTLSEIEAAVRASWGPDTAYATAAYLARGAERPSRGQCGPTALVVQSLLGGDLMVADVEFEGRVEGVHYWNVVPGGVELDLTRDQFVPAESLVDARRVTHGRNTSGAGEGAFQLLHERVTAALLHRGGGGPLVHPSSGTSSDLRAPLGSESSADAPTRTRTA